MANVSLEIESAALNQKEKRLLQKYEGDIRAAAEEAREGFRKMAEAFYQIREKRLYRETGSFTAYFQSVFGYGRSHANRIADAGMFMELSPRGDILEKLDSEAHFRLLGTLRKTPEKVEAVFELLEKSSAWRDGKEIPPHDGVEEFGLAVGGMANCSRILFAA